MNSMKNLSPLPIQEPFDLVPVFAREAEIKGQSKVAKCREYFSPPWQAIVRQVLRCA